MNQNCMDKKTKHKFAFFLSKFPELPLPLVLGEDAHLNFSKTNDPLQQELILQFIQPFEKINSDEFTEWVPCFRIPETHEFHAIVYWRAGLMDYQYVLMTYTKQGDLIDQRTIAGTFSDGKTLTQSVATLDEDWIISIASGQSDAQQSSYNASSSRAYQLELLPEGKIINVVD